MSDQHAIETICKLASLENEKALNRYLEESDICIGVLQGAQTALMCLAKEGNKKAVRFLLDKFNANINEAVEGAACGGHALFVDELIGQGASLDRAVLGAAHGGHFPLVNKLIDKGASLNCAAYGAGFGRQTNLGLALIKRSANPFSVAQGVAFGKYINPNQLIKEKEVIEWPDWEVMGAACCGNIKLVDDLILNHGANINFAVYSAAQTGNIELVDHLIKKHHANLNTAVRGAAAGGRIYLVNKLLKDGASLDWAVHSAALNGHIQLVNVLMKAGAHRDWAVRGAANGPFLTNQTSALRFITFIENAALRVALINYVCNHAIILKPQDLLAQVKKIQWLIQEYRFNFSKALMLVLKTSEQAKNDLMELKIWFLQGILTDPLPPEICLHISTFLTGAFESEVAAFYNRTTFSLNKQLLKNEINTLCLASSRFPKIHFFKTQHLDDRIQHTNNTDELLTVLAEEQKKNIEENVYDILQKHERRVVRTFVKF